MKIIRNYDRLQRKHIFECYNFCCAKCGKNYGDVYLELCKYGLDGDLIPLCQKCIEQIDMENLKRKLLQKQIKVMLSPKNNKRLYFIYRNMIQRCYNPKSPIYKNYGARGIDIYEEWLTSFENFCIWAKNTGYDENAKRGYCTIDRINNDKGYSPDNCRWADMKTQCNNRRKRGISNG